MNIDYLKTLSDNSRRDGFENRGISETKIQQLEQLYNNGNPFPKVLKELLFLAGDFCCFLDFGSFDSQIEMQDRQREKLTDYSGIVLTRPFFFVDLSSTDMPIFIYLDEGDNPDTYQVRDYEDSIIERRHNSTIKSLIESEIDYFKQGYSFY